MLPVPTVSDLVTFSGQNPETFTTYADEALVQATLLFGIKTKRTDLPDDPDQAQLALNGIMQMAERIIYEQPFVQVSASPLQSETIGSYSYSKLSQLSSARYGVKSLADTGLFWWDLAIAELTLEERSLVMSGSVEVAHMDLVRDLDGNLVVVSPVELHHVDVGFDMNTELNPRPRLG
jgi:hypothetical protein